MKEITLQDYEQIKEATLSNNHTESLMLAAKAYDLDLLVQILEHIEAISNLCLSTPKHLIEYRDHLQSELLEHVKSRYGNAAYVALNGSL